MATVFDLFRDETPVTITDDQGREAKFIIRSLTHGEQTDLFAELTVERVLAEQKFDTPELREKINKDAAKLTHEQISERLIMLERMVAKAEADLAPAGPDGQKRTVEEWEAQRRAELAQQPPEITLATFISRAMAQQTQARMSSVYMERSMVLSIRDPETRAQVFSSDPTAPNWINGLMPKTRELVEAKYVEFLTQVRDQELRRVAEAGPSVPSGASPSAPDGFRGETTATPLPSPTGSPVSTPSETG